LEKSGSHEKELFRGSANTTRHCVDFRDVLYYLFNIFREPR
jgi:hypothetical protein